MFCIPFSCSSKYLYLLASLFAALPTKFYSILSSFSKAPQFDVPRPLTFGQPSTKPTPSLHTKLTRYAILWCVALGDCRLFIGTQRTLSNIARYKPSLRERSIREKKYTKHQIGWERRGNLDTTSTSRKTIYMECMVPGWVNAAITCSWLYETAL